MSFHCCLFRCHCGIVGVVVSSLFLVSWCRCGFVVVVVLWLSLWYCVVSLLFVWLCCCCLCGCVVVVLFIAVVSLLFIVVVSLLFCSVFVVSLSLCCCFIVVVSLVIVVSCCCGCCCHRVVVVVEVPQPGLLPRHLPPPHSDASVRRLMLPPERSLFRTSGVFQ